MSSRTFQAAHYLAIDEVQEFCQSLAKDHPEWVRIQTIGETYHGRPIFCLTIGDHASGDISEKPAFWLDGGTHGMEWVGVMSVLWTMESWLLGLRDGNRELQQWFGRHIAVVVPCICPDGYHAAWEGLGLVRSTLRPGRPGNVRSGMEPQDINGDRAIHYMRWKHPAGNFVVDPKLPVLMRPRSLDDPADDAYFLSREGLFENWDQQNFRRADLRFGLDLNRNFPASWGPFSMFGMDGGAYPMSEPESRAVVDTFASFKCIGAALTNHSYTGCLLAQPYRQDTRFGASDIDLLYRLGLDLVKDTGYRVFKSYPDFAYDPKTLITGVWSDAVGETFGVPCYTVELWDPYDYVGVDNPNPSRAFLEPNPDTLSKLLAGLQQKHPDLCHPWQPFEHPQLGHVEVGGVDYLHCIHNPPESVLATECEKGFLIADRMRRALPDVRVSSSYRKLSAGEQGVVEIRMENLGFLSTSGLQHAQTLCVTPGVAATIELAPGQELIEGRSECKLEHLSGWGERGFGLGRNALMPFLSTSPHQTSARWTIKGSGVAKIQWWAGRAGRGTELVEIG